MYKSNAPYGRAYGESTPDYPGAPGFLLHMIDEKPETLGTLLCRDNWLKIRASKHKSPCSEG